MKNYNEIRNVLKKYKDCDYINDIYRIIIEKEGATDNKISKFSQYNNILIVLYFYINLILSGLLMMVGLLFEHKINFNKKIALARVSRTKNKISKIYEGVQFISDDIRKFDFMIYKIGERHYRMEFLLKSYIRLSLKEYICIKEMLKNKHLAPFASIVLMDCARRIPHTIIYKNAIVFIIDNYKLEELYTGQMYDRFALVEERIAKENKKKLVCIPHGIESTEEMPHGYIGDVFYCSSEEMVVKLNSLYETSKYIFDSSIMEKMYSIDNDYICGKQESKQKIIFFTQPIYTEESKSILQVISNYLAKRNQELFIKIHPLEKAADYNIENTQIISNFEEAIIGNICISLSSTVLLEAIYNNSTSISIVYLINGTNQLDGRYEFLNDHRILKPIGKIDMLKMLDSYTE